MCDLYGWTPELQKRQIYDADTMKCLIGAVSKAAFFYKLTLRE